MKTIHSLHSDPRSSFFARGLCGGLVTVVLFVLFAGFSSMNQAMAAGPGGSYKLVKATGTLSLGGDQLELDQAMIKNLIGAANGKVVVFKNQIKLDAAAAAEMMRDLGESFGFEVDATITGPKSLRLKKSGTAYVGKTSRPVVVNFQVNTGYDVVSGMIRSNFKVKVKGKTMVIDVPVSGELMGKSLKGKVKATCKKR